MNPTQSVFVESFLEQSEVHSSVLPKYDESKQQGIWPAIQGEPNVLFMSATVVHTSHGDSIGDESS
ncbi:MAG: hypothetical protein Q8R26_01190 [bacterium]|nr:hypothetical protein [bacterium]